MNRFRVVVGMLLAVAVSFGLMSVMSNPASAATPVKSKTVKVTRDDKMVKSVYAQHKSTRKKYAKRALKKNSCLQAYARAQAKRQATKRKMYHQNLRPALVKCDMRTVGENVAYGFTSANKLQKAWMNSPGHRRNILNNTYNRIGVGVYKAKNGARYYAVVLGRPM